jgi:hypothetical protein
MIKKNASHRAKSQSRASKSIYVTINNKQIASSTLTTNGQLTKAIL